MAEKPEKSLEQVVAELGRYPVDAFLFVQECIGRASEGVHGAMTAAETLVIKWMARQHLDPEQLRERYEAGELPPEIGAAIEQAGGPGRLNRHVTGQQLCYAVRDAALDRWGLMARGVFSRWGIQGTLDIGRIVFTLVDNGWLQKQPTDSIEDFDGVFRFDEAFDKTYRLMQ